MSFSPMSTWFFLLLYIITEIAFLFESLVVKIYIAKSTKDKNKSNGDTGKQHNDLTLLSGFRAFGKFAILPLIGLVLEYAGPQVVFAAMNAFPLILLVFTILLKEEDHEMNRGQTIFFRDLKQVLKLFKM